MNRYPIEILGIYIAPEHRIFGGGEKDLNGTDLVELSRAKLISGCGIEGDRFCQARPDYNGHLTFFSYEVWREIVSDLDLPDSYGPELTRRNVIVSGVDLKALYNTSFTIGDIQFMGTVHCAPCQGMNKALGKGARAAMRSRGGLRAQIKSSGYLDVGSRILATDASVFPERAAEQEPEIDLP